MSCADLMIDGMLCQYCGVFIDDDGADGCPRSCPECDEEGDDDAPLQRELIRDKKRSNREWSTSHLRELGYGIQVKNDGLHLIVSRNGKTADFWPGTGKWSIRGDGRYFRGVHELVRAMNGEIEVVSEKAREPLPSRLQCVPAKSNNRVVNEAINAEKQRKRERAKTQLAAAGIEFVSQDRDIQLYIERGDTCIDFWPGTGRWLVRGEKKHRRGGVVLLIAFLKGGK